MPGLADDIGKLTPHLRRFARALVRGHAAAAADDLVHETVLLAARRDASRTGPSLATWCYAALVRLNRARNRAPLIPADAVALPFLPRDMLRLDVLPLECREVLLLTGLAGLAYGQAADALDVAADEVIERLTRARDLLLKLEGDGAPRAGRTEPRARAGETTPYLRLVK